MGTARDNGIPKKIYVASRENLIASKPVAGRPVDLEDVRSNSKKSFMFLAGLTVVNLHLSEHDEYQHELDRLLKGH